MNTVTEKIEILRDHWLNACSAGLASELRAYCEMLIHPDVTWRDILDGFERPQIIAEQSLMRMRKEFNEIELGKLMHSDQAYWRSVLDKKRIDVSAPCRSYTTTTVNA